MAKEKHLRIESETKDLTFYYEIVGILSLVIPVLAFARLGVVGFYIMLVFKILFGDWYFLFLLTLFCYGLRCLIYHKPMNFKTLYNEQSTEYKEFSYTPNMKRPISIIDPETTEEVKPVLYFDEEANEVKGKCKLKPYKKYFAFEIRQSKK